MPGASAAVQVALGITGVSTVVGGLGRVNSALSGVGRGVGGTLATVGATIVAGATAATVALGGLGAVAGKTGNDFNALKEQALTAFTTMLGGKSQADAFLNQLQTFATKTNFEVPGLIKTSQFLLALGFQAKDIIPDLTAIGNQVAATGGTQANIDRVTLALGQMKAKGKVQGDEMLQLTENNISAWQYLADFLHTDIPTAMKMVTKGQVTGEQGVNAIIQGLSRDPKFAGMMEKQSHTFTGLVSNMHDYWTQFTGILEKPLFDRVLKPGLEWLTGWMSGPAQSAATRFAAGIDTAITRVTAAFQTVRGVVGNFREVLGGGLGAGTIGGSLATGFLLIRDSIANRVIPAIQLLWRTVAAGTGGINGMSLFQRVVLGVSRAVEIAARIFQLSIDSVVTFKQALSGEWFRNGAGNAFVNMVGRIGLAVRDLADAFRQGGVTGVLQRLWSDYLLPGLTEAWNQLRAWITGTAIPKVAEWFDDLRTRFSAWVGPASTALMVRLSGWLTAFRAWMATTAIPAVEGWVGGLRDKFVNWVRESLPPLMARLSAWLVGLGVWVQSTAVPALDRATQWLGDTLGNWVRDKAIPVMMAHLPGFLSTLTTWLVGAGFALNIVTMRLADILGGWVGRSAVELVKGGMEQWWGTIWRTLGMALVSAVTMTLRLGIAIGQGIGKGIIAGLQANFPDFYNKIVSWVNSWPEPIRRLLNGGSPFTVNPGDAPGQNNGAGSFPQPGAPPSQEPGGTTQSSPGGNAPQNIVYLTVQGPTNEEIARSLAGMIATELEPMIGPSAVVMA